MSAFAEFVSCKIAQAVVGRIFICFAERRIVENLLDEFVDRQIVVENHHADMNEFCGIFANDARRREVFYRRGQKSA